MTSIAIMQPVYLPWLGYFEQTALCDEFVILDNVQYTKQDWRNRNRIRTKEGWTWLTIPVERPNLTQLLNEIRVDYNKNWTRKHLAALAMNYRPCPYFEPTYSLISTVLLNKHPYLTDITIALIKAVAQNLGIETRLTIASELPIQTQDRQHRVLDLCKSNGADVYYSGLSAKQYLDVQLFDDNGVAIHFQNYQHPVYSQHFVGFESHISIIDLMMNHGPDALNILLSSPNPEFKL